MSESLFIITGASRGMGAAIAEKLLQPHHTVLGISRRTNASLAAKASSIGATLEQWPRDLAQCTAVAREVDAWLARFEPDRFSAATLINNAGVITPPGPIDDLELDELSSSLRVGLEATILLTACFLGRTRDWRAMKDSAVKVLNISSGLGRRAMAGAAPYCAAKAGMDHFSRAVALDEAHRGVGARIVSLAPGVIDTDMQVQLRSADASGFPDKPTFDNLQASGQLMSPEEAATRVLAYLSRSDFGKNPVGDVRE
jgi:NAD(P)-dependent dehydrogenase (short-subunit alcohol dehydrogenase family)